MSKSSRGELDAGREAQLGVTRELGVGGAVEEEVFGWESAFEGGEDVLGCHTMAYIAPIIVSMR